jgi:hypothetical protein
MALSEIALGSGEEGNGSDGGSGKMGQGRWDERKGLHQRNPTSKIEVLFPNWWWCVCVCVQGKTKPWWKACQPRANESKMGSGRSAGEHSFTVSVTHPHNASTQYLTHMTDTPPPSPTGHPLQSPPHKAPSASTLTLSYS